jgi:RNA polymerase sigma factor (sigma-70 family)
VEARNNRPNEHQSWNRIITDLKPVIRMAITKTIFNLSKEDAQDLQQDIIFKVYIKYHLFDTNRNFKDWVYVLSVNHAIDYLRKSKRILESRESEKEINMSLSNSRTDKLLIIQLLNKIPVKYRACLYEKFITGFKQKEIALRHNLPIGTVSGLIQKGVQQLKRLAKNENLNKADFILYE